MPYLFEKIDKISRQEFVKSKKEMKRCKKMYPDWEDNEFNCGPLKFIWGVLSEDNIRPCEPSFYSLNDIDICYNRDTKKYLLGIETIYLFETAEEEIEYLERLLKEFTKYTKETHRKYRKNDFGLKPLSHGELFVADSIEELYFNFKLFVHGYKDLKRSRK